MTKIFEAATINGMTLPNRLVRSATWEGMCEVDGRPTDKVVEWYRDLAQGGIGLIISGYAFVRPEGKQLPGKMGIHTDDFSTDYKKITDAVHSAGCKIILQIVHAGGETDSQNAGQQPLAPSAIQVEQFPEMPKELTKDEIDAISSAFAKAAQRAKEWGFDGVQLHGAHGYLISQFLSPHTNRREDEYGGNIENRNRFVVEIYAKIRDAVGPDFPLLIKLNGSDNLAGGLEYSDALYTAKKLSDAGIDCIEISGGTPASGDKGPVREKITKPEREAYNLELASKIKKEVSCPVMAVGGFRSYGVIQQAIEEHNIDFISMARPLIREPALASRWKQGDHSPAKCISCNKCFLPGIKEGGIYCVVEKKAREKASKK